MSEYKVAFFIGLFSSIHCIGMCGPLAFAIPVKGTRFVLLLWDKLSYQMGRVITYSILGLMVGLMGRQIWLSGMQQAVSLISGALVILVALGQILHWQNSTWVYWFMAPVNRLMVFALQQRYGHFMIGIINGLLPCGFVYLAIAGALTTVSVTAWGAVKYMFCFGMGTLPLMLLATLGVGLIDQRARRYINKGVPFLMLFLGIWFLLRGLQLDIAYLSPKAQGAPSSICK